MARLRSSWREGLWNQYHHDLDDCEHGNVASLPDSICGPAESQKTRMQREYCTSCAPRLPYLLLLFLFSSHPLYWDSSHFLPICFWSTRLPSALLLPSAVGIVITWTLDSPVGNWFDLFWQQLQVSQHSVNSNLSRSRWFAELLYEVIEIYKIVWRGKINLV